MADIEKKAKKIPPKGGKKGGTRYPKMNLEQAIGYSEKLVSKTHTGPLAEATILPGVFGASGTTGQVRASALKQYGLLEGPATAYKATQLAKDIDAAPEEDLPPLLQRSFLSSKVFKELFDTFHGDTISKAKIEQRARGLEVHPESAEECAQLFIESAVTARVGTANGDSLTLIKAGDAATAVKVSEDVDDEAESEEQEEEAASATPPASAAGSSNSDQSQVEKGIPQPPMPRTEKPAVTLALTVDATSDPDKLEKQLKLLRQYGVI